MARPVRSGSTGAAAVTEEGAMRTERLPIIGVATTLRDVLAHLAVVDGLSDVRRRDLISAVRCYANVVGAPPSAIPLDLAAIRERLDTMAPAEVRVSEKS